MVKRICALFLALILTAGSSFADLKWQEITPAQKALKTYISNVNGFLLENGEPEVNSIFEQLNDVAELGITSADNSDMPEDVTVTVYMYYDSLNRLILRVNDASRFGRIAAAFLRALNPGTMTQEESLKTPTERASKAIKAPADSFRDYVEDEMLNGTSPRTFYSYHPNQYYDGVNWMQLMIIFPLAEYWNEETGIITGTEDTPMALSNDPDQAKEYEGYYSEDSYTHMDVTVTATPEPDSAAMEYDEWTKKKK